MPSENDKKADDGNSSSTADFSKLPLRSEIWLKRDLPPADYLIGDWMTTTSRALFTADTGIGKTNFGLAAFTHLAAGIDFLHWRITKPRRVLYVDGEMSRRLLRQRLEDATRRLGAIPAGLHVLSHEDVEDFQPLNTEAGQKFIFDVVEHVRAEAVAFDNVMALIIGDMKDEDAWRDTLPLVNQLTKQNVGQIWVHHTGHDASRSYGTKTREWRMDTTLHATAVERPDTERVVPARISKGSRAVAVKPPRLRRCHHSARQRRMGRRRRQTRGPKGSVPAGGEVQALQNAIASGETTMFQSWKAVTMDQWRAECCTLGLIDKDKADSARSLLSRYKRELIGCNLIACNNDLAWIIKP